MMFSSARRVWDEWNIRCVVLLSLFFQVVLIVFANFRKRRGSLVLRATIWSSYLLADWIAAFAVGLISSRQTDDCPDKFAVSKQLAAFWAPFLLLHLGGPDAITAFSLEDNELWIRHLLGLVIQLLAVVYVLLQSLPNELWIPTVLMLFAGTCKYAERTISLYLACLGNFKRSLLPKPDPGPNYAQFMEEYSVLEDSYVPVEIHILEETQKKDSSASGAAEGQNQQISESLGIVVDGYKFFQTFKGLVVDHMFSFNERNESRKFFFSRTAVDAFKIMEVELNFMYDALYTKNAAVHRKIGYICRFLCTALIVACFHRFVSHPLHNDITYFDKIVTYILLVGAVFLDLVGVFNLLFSDWTVVSAAKILSKVLDRLPLGKGDCGRWSNTISQHNFISFCLRKERLIEWLSLTADFLKHKDTLDELLYKTEEDCEKELKQFIFNELRAKAARAKTRNIAKEIYSARGDRVLSDYTIHYTFPSISSSLSDEVEYDESLLLWHVATELCYFTSSDDSDEKRKFCKVLSDYMLYLLVMRPTLMSAVAGIAQIRFQDTCAEAKRCFRRWQSELTSSSDPQENAACKMLLDVKTVVKPKEVKGDRSQSVLFDACILANDLNKLRDEERWEMMSKIWVELLSYAASHCRPDAHVRQLSQGGELITFVWLQMVHFGLGEQFRIEKGHARPKLLVKQVKRKE